MVISEIIKHVCVCVRVFALACVVGTDVQCSASHFLNLLSYL